MKPKEGHAEQRHGQLRRLPMLRNAMSGTDEVEFRNGVPGTRGECPKYRPCNYVRCEWNLRMRTGLDAPGRRRLDHAEPASTLVPCGWNNCGADYADAAEGGHEFDADEIAEAMGIDERSLRRIKRSALTKLKRDPDAEPILMLVAAGGRR